MIKIFETETFGQLIQPITLTARIRLATQQYLIKILYNAGWRYSVELT